jgi:hypothetical protein
MQRIRVIEPTAAVRSKQPLRKGEHVLITTAGREQDRLKVGIGTIS